MQISPSSYLRIRRKCNVACVFKNASFQGKKKNFKKKSLNRKKNIDCFREFELFFVVLVKYRIETNNYYFVRVILTLIHIIMKFFKNI